MRVRAVMQAAGFERLPFDPFSLSQNGIVAAKVGGG